VELPVRIVLVETSHPGNIGAAARAMKAMGLRDLALVSPKHFPSEEATARAAGAADVLDGARVYATLTEAIEACGFVAGASARMRTIHVPVVDPRECAESILARPGGARAAIVFGPEQSGLTNEDLARCDVLVNIPTVADFSSLNLAMAVQVLCYELRMAARRPEPAVGPARDASPATAGELEHFHQHLERVLTDAGFLHPAHQRQVKLKLRRVFHRAELDQNELSILHGMVTALDPRARSRPTG
jgi:tRNA (cytidine32/uridine32-2'-O)-methyltransferase